MTYCSGIMTKQKNKSSRYFLSSIGMYDFNLDPNCAFKCRIKQSITKNRSNDYKLGSPIVPKFDNVNTYGEERNTNK